MTEPIKWPERFEALGLPAASGVLLYGGYGRKGIEGVQGC